ncbi:hypothetical protein CR513_25173, partial [Mucuna pruriens]
MKHIAKDHSIFSIDIIDELVEEHMQIYTGSANFSDFVEIPDVKSRLNFVEDIFDSVNIFLIEDGLTRRKVDTTLLRKESNKDFIIVKIYVDDIIFCAIDEAFCKKFS